MKIDPNRKGFVLFVEAISAYCDRHSVDIKSFINGTGEVEAKLIINGYEIDLGDCLELMEISFDHATQKAAKVLIEEEYGEINDRIEKLKEMIEEDCNKLTEHFNLSNDQY
jgi:hypothetical protein